MEGIGQERRESREALRDVSRMESPLFSDALAGDGCARGSDGQAYEPSMVGRMCPSSAGCRGSSKAGDGAEGFRSPCRGRPRSRRGSAVPEAEATDGSEEATSDACGEADGGVDGASEGLSGFARSTLNLPTLFVLVFEELPLIVPEYAEVGQAGASRSGGLGRLR